MELKLVDNFDLLKRQISRRSSQHEMNVSHDHIDRTQKLVGDGTQELSFDPIHLVLSQALLALLLFTDGLYEKAVEKGDDEEERKAKKHEGIR
jgi:hypothetical protein